VGVLFGREKRQAFPERIIPPFRTNNGRIGGTESPMMVPAVWMCTSLIAGSVSMLPLETKRTVDSMPRRVTDPSIIVEPEKGKTQSEFLHEVMVSLVLTGNAYGRIIDRDAYNRPTQLALQSPTKVKVEVDDHTGAVSYRLTGSSTNTVVAAENMWHVRGITMPGSQTGLSPMEHAESVLNIDFGSRKFANDFYAAGGIPNGVIESDQEITQEQAQTIKDRWRAATASREVAVMGAGAKYTQVSVKPDESQFLATQKENLAQLARFFSLDPAMIGGPAGTTMTYTNMEQRNSQFRTYTLGFWIKRLEDSFSALLSGPTYVTFNDEAFMRGDVETQAKVDNQHIAAKIIAPSEVRYKKNLPPMTPEQLAEVNMVPLTVTPLGGVKALPGLKDPSGPEAPIPDSETTPNGQPHA
jgi:HK97 family phage portal protein